MDPSPTDPAWLAAYDALEPLIAPGPSIVGELAAFRLAGEPPARVLDLACGEGRDAVLLSRTFGCEVLGVDASAAAIESARRLAAEERLDRVRFVCADFGALGQDSFGLVLVANLYHVLRAADRARLAALVARWVAPGGLVLLNALSVDDPEEYGQGTPEDEPDSFTLHKFLHFSTRDELEAAFGGLRIEALDEIEYDEPHADGPMHRHVAWVLAARQD